ncbi:hypothetical protein ABZ208_10050 [Streptomyces sp. NPDC006208]|uniref:hypothetical protein n=1 Tax=Streptomyces sp. NPDC006208 TaxID=3156734 RepID=UPI0033BAE0A0
MAAPAAQARSTSAAAHTGPYGACTVVGHIAPGTTVEYDCYVRNDHGSSWTRVREPGGGSLGRVHDAHLSGGRSDEPCDRWIDASHLPPAARDRRGPRGRPMWRGSRKHAVAARTAPGM